jgi:hypothetical protein
MRTERSINRVIGEMWDRVDRRMEREGQAVAGIGGRTS